MNPWEEEIVAKQNSIQEKVDQAVKDGPDAKITLMLELLQSYELDDIHFAREMITTLAAIHCAASTDTKTYALMVSASALLQYAYDQRLMLKKGERDEGIQTDD